MRAAIYQGIRKVEMQDIDMPVIGERTFSSRSKRQVYAARMSAHMSAEEMLSASIRDMSLVTNS